MTEPCYLLDSNICIYLLNGLSSRLEQRVAQQAAETLFVSSISVAEIAVGYGATIDDAPELRGFLEEILPLPFDEAAAMAYATLPFKRGSFDRLIAAHALSLGLTIVTNNMDDFAQIPGLMIEDWTI